MIIAETTQETGAKGGKTFVTWDLVTIYFGPAPDWLRRWRESVNQSQNKTIVILG